MNILIHADAGARSGFVAAWLTNCLSGASFDVGISFKPNFFKIHQLFDHQLVRSYNGLKIRIRPKIDTIDLHLLLFLRKNLYTMFPDFTRDEHSFETFTKLSSMAKDIFEEDRAADCSLYDIVLDFADTFDNEYMINLYTNVVGIPPTTDMIDHMIATNNLNTISIDKNHACSIVKLCLKQEHDLKLKEEHRFWSIVDIYNSTPVEKLYDTVYESITPKNYGIFLKST